MNTVVPNALEAELINEYQRGFPLQSRPFAVVAEALGVAEAEVLTTLRRLRQTGALSRVGPVLRPQAFGASTLAAMAVPPRRLGKVAAQVSALPEVNHNYEREHRYNLWFVVTGEDRARVAEVLCRIGEDTGLPVLDLPLVQDYHIDLGFRLDGKEARRRARLGRVEPLRLSERDRRVLAAVQDGLSLEPRPYRAAAETAGCSEDELLARLQTWLDGGWIRRFGLVVRHHELGFRANGMAVWDLPDALVDELGERFAEYPFVTLCYRRPRRAPDWPYNLFCMIHGRDRATVEAQFTRLATDCGLADAPRALLFSRRRFKQRGARYCTNREAYA